jgi:hypothetical protein
MSCKDTPRPCGEGRRADSDKDQDMRFHGFYDEPLGLNPEIIAASNHVIGDVLFAATQRGSADDTVIKTRVRYKPREVTAVYMDSENVVTREMGGKNPHRKTGWIVPGPGRTLIYVKEEDFNAFFEIIGDEQEI